MPTTTDQLIQPVKKEQSIHHQEDGEDDDDDSLLMDSAALFIEPEGFRPPPDPPTLKTFERRIAAESGQPQTLDLQLVGQHSLWAHQLWNGGMSMAHYIDSHPDLVSGKRVLELGAASGLPSLISTLKGASWVALTDYPDSELILNMTRNVETNLTPTQQHRVTVQGFQWGQPVSNLISTGLYDLILLADLIFNHTEHYNLLKSCKECLDSNGSVLVIFTHHVVKWAERDLKFFERATEPQFGFRVENLGIEKWPCMFPMDAGSEEVRSTVNMYRLTLDPQVQG